MLNLSTGTDHNQVIQLLLEQLNRIIFRFHQICSTICVWLVASIQHFAGLEDDFSLVSPYPLKYFGGHQFQFALSNWLDLTDRCWIALFILKADAGCIMVWLAFISIDMKDGTLVLPLWLSRGENAHLPACFACLYSQDQGESWQCSEIVPAANGTGDPTEASVAERQDGTLLATMRHEKPGVRRRAFAQSGPVCWSQPWMDQNLPDPVCSGALLSLEGGKMVFVNCAYGDEPALERQRQGENVRWSLDARQNLTVRLSQDDGRTWSDGLLVEREAGASDLACSPDGKIVYCFYEQGWTDGNCIFNRALVLARVPLDRLH